MSPFDQEPPRWLQSIAKPVDGEALGKSLTVSLLSLSKAFERDPSAPQDASWLGSRKGLNTGLYETQQDAQDPQWRVKGQILANKVLEQKANLAAEAAIANEKTKETSAWMEDAPNLTPWITATPEQRRTMAAPLAKSRMGMQTLQKQSIADQTYYTKQDQMDNRLEQERLKADHSAGITARVQDWNDAVAAASPDVFSQIEALGPKGRLPSGLPTPQAIALLNIDRQAKNMVPYGVKASEMLDKPGKMSPQETMRMKNLQAQANHFQKIVENQNTDEPTRTAAQAKLDDLNRQIQGGPSAAVPKATAPFQKEIDDVQNKIDLVGTPAGKDFNLNKLNQDKASWLIAQSKKMNRGLSVTPYVSEKDSTSDIAKKVASLPVGSTLVWNVGDRPDYIHITDDSKKKLLAKLGAPVQPDASTGTTSRPRVPIPGIAPPESAFPSAAPQTGKGAGSAQRQAAAYATNKKARIEELTNLLNNANKGRGHSMTRQEYTDKYDELEKLMSE